ncbi:hypothetical protein T492DRAFT_1033658 [Pavlovales sp. CCMP2436]|nr:hypothetical protein T492DRAFT_1033658 [Pavlovales sp. CCMP2436]|mmetsp:Transcript_45128/g.111914  ORF Transcript_45128/g.111914 Transcript_45128/m.111914 type:complete len:399 (+) Transcript_45128:52-1248(+)|eukprot:CAMPEP_0179921904 /NCGR_PEP_ID=MMETSP0983-20121128/5320_1 /TAXON_ID=483367 /ORGANISM="non described non described, Strain CCMP 2436" /LENGTH=398 /DNA_ID=CAMNT_0021825147 /DNA_START=17 /DNA_END=1213 /DNA_ORIENTATION=-
MAASTLRGYLQVAPEEVELLPPRPTRANACRGRRTCCCLLLLLALASAWAVAAVKVCRNCNRIGNFVDVWLQREILRAAGSVCADRGWEDAQVTAIGNGVAWRRVVHMGWLRGEPLALVAHIGASRAGKARVNSAFVSLVRARLRGRLNIGCRRLPHETGAFTLAYAYDALAVIRPVLSETMHALLDSHSPIDSIRFPAGALTCVVHVRLGDYHPRARAGNSSAAAATPEEVGALLAGAARTFAPPPTRFEILESGVSHGCTGERCGQVTLLAIERALQLSFPHAEVALVIDGTPDRDFARAARAPMLLIGSGGSFANFAAAANRGQVRSPQCTLLPEGLDAGEVVRQRCWPLSEALPAAAGGGAQGGGEWRVYAHPLCSSLCGGAHAANEPRARERR